LVNASKHGNREALLSMVNATAAEKVWQIPVFKESFCDDFVEELIHFESSDVPKGRPNTMNKHGVSNQTIHVLENLEKQYTTV